MSTAALRPLLRPSNLPSLPFASSSTVTNTITTATSNPISRTTKTTYICQSCRHARLLRRPKRPYTFTQLVTLSDGSAFTMRTTSPVPVYRSTRDTRNSPLWNPSSKELANVEDDEAGRLAGFRARFGIGFDAQKEDLDDVAVAAASEASSGQAVEEGGAPKPQPESLEVESANKMEKAQKSKKQRDLEEEVHYEFEEDDANLLDLISSYGQAPAAQNAPAPTKKGKK